MPFSFGEETKTKTDEVQGFGSGSSGFGGGSSGFGGGSSGFGGGSSGFGGGSSGFDTDGPCGFREKPGDRVRDNFPARKPDQSIRPRPYRRTAPINIPWRWILIVLTVAAAVTLCIVFREEITAFIAQIFVWVITIAVILLILRLIFGGGRRRRRW